MDTGEAGAGGVRDDADMDFPPGPAIQVPSAESTEACQSSKDTMTVVTGTLDGKSIDHGFCQISTVQCEATAPFICVDGAFGGDGYVYTLVDKAVGSTTHEIQRGLFRLPSKLPALHDTWYCIDHGVAEIAGDGTMRFQVDRISALGSRADAEPGIESLKGRYDRARQSPLQNLQNGRGDYYWGYVSVETGRAMAQARLQPAAGSFDDGWRMLGFRGASDAAEDFTATMLIDYGDAAQPIQVAFPSAQSAIAWDFGDTIDADLREISAPLSCAGAKVDANLTFYIRRMSTE
jgi:hypothetical protein